MSVMRSLRSRVAVLLLGALAALTIVGLTGCGGKKDADPYVYASLRAVTRGDTLSKNFLFEIDAPRFDYVKGNTGIVRDGNLLEFVVGTNLEQAHQTYAGSLLGVQKFFTPTPFLMVKRVKRGGVATPVDSCTNAVVPRVIKISENDAQTPGFNFVAELNWKNLESMKALLPKDANAAPVQVQSAVERFVWMPRHDMAAPGPNDNAWYAIFPEATLQIDKVTPGASWMMELLKSRNLPLVGSFSVTEADSNYASRRAEHGALGHVVGKMQINWFRYANAFIKGTAE